MLIEEQVCGSAVAPTFREQLTMNYPLVERVVRSVARRHRLRPHDLEDLGSIVSLRLVENDYAILRKYQGRSSLATYLTTVVKRIYLDWRVAQWGKWRPSARARRLGETALKLEQLTGRHAMTCAEACQNLRTNFGVTATDAELEAIYDQLPRRVRRSMVGDDALRNVAAPEVEDGTDRRLDDLAHSLAVLGRGDREMLLRVYVDNLPVTTVARERGVDVKWLYRQLEGVRRRLRAALTVSDRLSPAVPCVPQRFRD